MYLRFPSSRRSQTNFERAAAVQARSCSCHVRPQQQTFQSGFLSWVLAPIAALRNDAERLKFLWACLRRKRHRSTLLLWRTRSMKYYGACVGFEFFGVEVEDRRVARGHIEELMACLDLSVWVRCEPG